jgi:hypothetical protein
VGVADSSSIQNNTTKSHHDKVNSLTKCTCIEPP